VPRSQFVTVILGKCKSSAVHAQRPILLSAVLSIPFVFSVLSVLSALSVLSVLPILPVLPASLPSSTPLLFLLFHQRGPSAVRSSAAVQFCGCVHFRVIAVTQFSSSQKASHPSAD
jgi:hypothetical protein